MSLVNIGNNMPEFKSESMLNAKRVYENTFGSMPEEKRRILTQMCSAFQCAGSAYEKVLEADEAKRIIDCGVTAAQYLTHYNIVATMLGSLGQDEVLAKMQSSSDWLIAKGWYGLPTPKDKEGNIKKKTAVEVHADMKRFLEIYQRYFVALKEEADKQRR